MLRPTVGVPRAVLVLSVYEPPVRELVSFDQAQDRVPEQERIPAIVEARNTKGGLPPPFISRDA